MNLLHLLKGNDVKAQERLNELVNQHTNEPKLLWYPSAGFDFRDVLRFSMKHDKANVGVSELPDLFVHTDYMMDRNALEVGELMSDGRTKIDILACHELSWTIPFHYSAMQAIPDHRMLRRNQVANRTHSPFCHAPEKLPAEPIVYLLDVQFQSHVLGPFQRPVVYVVMENMNFLCEILLRYKLSISHVVKVRDGTGFGGNAMSVAQVYPFFSELKTQYLITDDRAQLVWGFIKHAMRFYTIEPKMWEIKEVGVVQDWSGFVTTAFKIEHSDERLSSEHLDEQVKKITEETPIRKHFEELNHRRKMIRIFG
jgi:hypothetical protein